MTFPEVSQLDEIFKALRSEAGENTPLDREVEMIDLFAKSKTAARMLSNFHILTFKLNDISPGDCIVSGLACGFLIGYAYAESQSLEKSL